MLQYKDYKNNILLIKLLCLLFSFNIASAQTLAINDFTSVICGDQQFKEYLPLLKNKRVAVLTNVTGVVGNKSIVDTLLKLKVKIKKIFGPEHGFRGDTEAGEKVNHNKDSKTGIQIISLYGKNKKPTSEQLKNIDVLIYDIQDVGVRFYTYISTLAYAMEACAENGKEIIVLDRPNPNGFYIDGPILKKEWTSFLGLHAVPIVYGMTCGEYAKMVNEEGWLKNNIQCKLKIIPLKNYDRDASYELPIKPSPNLPNATSILLYPSLGLFEGTIISLGRGTDAPFQMIGHPNYPDTSFSFMPKPTKLSKEPKYFNQKCYGLDLKTDDYLKTHPKKINIVWLINMYTQLKRDNFFDDNFSYHAGSGDLKTLVQNKISEAEIRKTWQEDLERFKRIRQKYLLYPDFN